MPPTFKKNSILVTDIDIELKLTGYSIWNQNKAMLFWTSTSLSLGYFFLVQSLGYFAIVYQVIEFSLKRVKSRGLTTKKHHPTRSILFRITFSVTFDKFNSIDKIIYLNWS